MQEQQSGSLKSESPEAESPLPVILCGIVYGGSCSALNIQAWGETPANVDVRAKKYLVD